MKHTVDRGELWDACNYSFQYADKFPTRYYNINDERIEALEDVLVALNIPQTRFQTYYYDYDYIPIPVTPLVPALKAYVETVNDKNIRRALRDVPDDRYECAFNRICWDDREFRHGWKEFSADIVNEVCERWCTEYNMTPIRDPRCAWTGEKDREFNAASARIMQKEYEASKGRFRRYRKEKSKY